MDVLRTCPNCGDNDLYGNWRGPEFWVECWTCGSEFDQTDEKLEEV
jgi:Zn ribbon nucleic-acid-binding protein